MSKRNRRRAKPMTPAEIMEKAAARRAEQRDADKRLEYGINTQAATLPANADVTVIKGQGKDKAQTAHRDDVFARLIKSEAQLRAVRRLESDMAEQSGQAWRPGERVTVDSSQFPPGQNIAQSRINAGRRVSAVLALTGARCAWLLKDLINRAEYGFPAPANDEGEKAKPREERIAPPFDWRLVVQFVTGEKNEHAQAARVRAACDNLVAAYAMLDNPRAANDDRARISA